jgi:hypothetical protein
VRAENRDHPALGDVAEGELRGHLFQDRLKRAMACQTPCGKEANRPARSGQIRFRFYRPKSGKNISRFLYCTICESKP